MNVERKKRSMEIAYKKTEKIVYLPGAGTPVYFVGRTDLLRELYSLWGQPEAKPAVVLMGQRRIGKTSLLHKIENSSNASSLIPIFVDIQGCASEYEFLCTMSKKMAQSLNEIVPKLEPAEPYMDFKNFLLNLTSKLGERYFLLMLDEADLIFGRNWSDLTQDFLRSLMQDPSYPVLLLICGTHMLKDVIRDRKSILFNTAIIRRIGYMTEEESKELLQVPAKDILKFDPWTLTTAYRLSRGHPMLLQQLGYFLIQEFNSVIDDDKTRSNYVSLKDLDQVVQKVIRAETNAAFDENWHRNCDVKKHRLLCALACITSEDDRTQLDIDGIEKEMQELGLQLPRSDLYKILEQLSDEEILVNKEHTYSFAIPLYRRWIEWRWYPDKVRTEPYDEDE